jgi:hypothetical protein
MAKYERVSNLDFTKQIDLVKNYCAELPFWNTISDKLKKNLIVTILDRVLVDQSFTLEKVSETLKNFSNFSTRIMENDGLLGITCERKIPCGSEIIFIFGSLDLELNYAEALKIYDSGIAFKNVLPEFLEVEKLYKKIGKTFAWWDVKGSYRKTLGLPYKSFDESHAECYDYDGNLIGYAAIKWHGRGWKWPYVRFEDTNFKELGTIKKFTSNSDYMLSILEVA